VNHIAVTTVKVDYQGMITDEFEMKFIKTKEDFIIIDRIKFDFSELPVGEKYSYTSYHFDEKLGENDYSLFIMIMRVK